MLPQSSRSPPRQRSLVEWFRATSPIGDGFESAATGEDSVSNQSIDHPVAKEFAAGLDVHALSAQQYLSLIQSAPAKGIRGGSFFDALHAQAARENHCAEIHTLNVRHFQHVAPDLTIRGL